MSPRFTFTTWNILANAYIRTEYYPNTPPEILNNDYRRPAIVKRACQLDADILCLQEVERDAFTALETALVPLGYAGHLAMKGAPKPDGCATFYRSALFRLLDAQRILYADGGDAPNSGHVAQLLTLDFAGRRLDLINTHLKWDPPATPRDLQWGYRQASQALSALPLPTPAGVQILCGDFNVTADSAVVRLLISAGFAATHPPAPGSYSCNSSREPKLIDYIFFRGPLQAEAVALPRINGATPLPSATEPSDHLPLLAHFSLTGYV
jgi:CCR4-NOT transcription complex subunit 6